MAITISGTTGIAGVDGSAGTPAVQGADTNTGVFYPAADTVGVSTGGSERVRVDSSGNVGIGTSSPASRLNIATGASTSCTMRFTANNTGTGAGDRGRLDFYSADNSGNAYQLGYMDYDRADGTGTASYIAWASRVSGTVAERMRIDSSGNLQFNSGYGSVATAYGCRAWVNFNGTGTVAIRASGNVTSITDNGVGDYTVNFTTAISDANYTTVAQTSSDSGTALIVNINSNNAGNTTPTTSATRMLTFTRSGGSATDSPYVNVSVFR